jgi:hypothetical protein
MSAPLSGGAFQCLCGGQCAAEGAGLIQRTLQLAQQAISRRSLRIYLLQKLCHAFLQLRALLSQALVVLHNLLVL